MSSPTYVVDAHALLWYLCNDRRLSPAAAQAIEREDALIVIPAIALAEIASCHARRRTSVSLGEALAFVDDCGNCLVAPVDRQVVELLPSGHDIHDGLIVATALLYRDVFGCEVTLITADQDITSSALIPTLW